MVQPVGGRYAGRCLIGKEKGLRFWFKALSEAVRARCRAERQNISAWIKGFGFKNMGNSGVQKFVAKAGWTYGISGNRMAQIKLDKCDRSPTPSSGDETFPWQFEAWGSWRDSWRRATLPFLEAVWVIFDTTLAEGSSPRCRREKGPARVRP